MLKSSILPSRGGAAGLALALVVGLSGPARAEAPFEIQDRLDQAIHDHLKAHPEEVEAIVQDYLTSHPEALRAALGAMFRKSRETKTAPAPAPVAVARDNAAALYASPHQVTLGARDGEVTLVEFFDYNCGFCRRALSDTQALLKAQPKLRIVLKELPVLGPGSVEAARVAVAVRMQDPDGARYFAFHEKMLGGHVQNDMNAALGVAGDLGFDVEQLRKDMDSDEARATLAEDAKLARDLGVTGTPSYVIADQVVVGAVGIAALKDKIEAASK